MPTIQPKQPQEPMDEPRQPREATALQTAVVLSSFGFAAGVTFWFGYLAFVGTSYTVKSPHVSWFYNSLSAIENGAVVLSFLFVVSSCSPIRIRYAIAAGMVWMLLTSGWLYFFMTECLTRGATKVVIGTVALMSLSTLLLVAVCISNKRLMGDCGR